MRNRFCRQVFFFFAATTLVGCSSAEPSLPAYVVEEPAAPAGALRLLALGDSYTIGQGVSPAERWPTQLVASLRKQGIEMAEPTIIAQTGWTTDELASAIARTKLKERYALVSLLIGVNNQYRGRDVAEYRVQFTELLKKAIELAGGIPDRVLVLSIPDWGATPMARSRNPAEIGKAIDQFNEVNRDEALRAGARYVEITVASRLATDDPALIVRDGLHPSRKMYAQWVEAALPSAMAALKIEQPAKVEKGNAP